MRTEYLHDGTAHVYDETADTPTRYVVWQDTDSESPANWNSDDTVMVYNTSPRGGRDKATCELSEVFERAYDTHDADKALDITRRYARVCLGWTPERAEGAIVTYSARGYSQSDWWDILAITWEDEYAESLAKEWEQWARGDVWEVMAEYGEECDKGDLHWDTVNDQGINSYPVGGIYADSAEDAITQYLAIA
jgi:hypothetical protein